MVKVIREIYVAVRETEDGTENFCVSIGERGLPEPMLACGGEDATEDRLEWLRKEVEACEAQGWPMRLVRFVRADGN